MAAVLHPLMRVAFSAPPTPDAEVSISEGEHGFRLRREFGVEPLLDDLPLIRG